MKLQNETFSNEFHFDETFANRLFVTSLVFVCSLFTLPPQQEILPPPPKKTLKPKNVRLMRDDF